MTLVAAAAPPTIHVTSSASDENFMVDAVEEAAWQGMVLSWLVLFAGRSVAWRL
jgi:hypothetical protein